MQTELGHELTRAVLTTTDVFLREGQRLFRPHGITAAQYNVLSALAAAGDGMSQRELGDLLVVDRSNVTGLVDRMEKAGWVRRSDGRPPGVSADIDASGPPFVGKGMSGLRTDCGPGGKRADREAGA